MLIYPVSFLPHQCFAFSLPTITFSYWKYFHPCSESFSHYSSSNTSSYLSDYQNPPQLMKVLWWKSISQEDKEATIVVRLKMCYFEPIRLDSIFSLDLNENWGEPILDEPTSPRNFGKFLEHSLLLDQSSHRQVAHLRHSSELNWADRCSSRAWPYYLPTQTDESSKSYPCFALKPFQLPLD